MQYYRCKCGRFESWTSMGARPRCEACPDCGTTLAQSPAGHGEPEPHDFSCLEQVETDNGQATLTRCCHCLKTRAEIAKREAREVRAKG